MTKYNEDFKFYNWQVKYFKILSFTHSLFYIIIIVVIDLLSQRLWHI